MKKLSSETLQDFIQIDRQSYAIGNARCERRTIEIRLRLVVEKIVYSRIDIDALPDMVLQHQLTDGIALVNILPARLRFALTAPGESRIERIMP